MAYVRATDGARWESVSASIRAETYEALAMVAKDYGVSMSAIQDVALVEILRAFTGRDLETFAPAATVVRRELSRIVGEQG